MRILIAAVTVVMLAGCTTPGDLKSGKATISASSTKTPKQYALCVMPKICFAAFQTGNVPMGKRLERIREWLTPRTRLWAGIALYAVTFAVPLISPGTSVSWLIGPASVLFVGSFIPATGKKR